jgi:O-antigen ligase
LAKYFKIKKAVLFVVLFFGTIASTEIIEYFQHENLFVIGSVLFFVTALTSLIRVVGYQKLIIFSLIFIFALMVSALRATDFEYGIYKIILGLLVPLIFWSYSTKILWSEKELINYLILSVLIIDVIGVLYKINFGFFDRNVKFGLFGPITFGWINGMAFVVSFLKKDKNFYNKLLTAVFGLLILWSGSKGPLLVSILMVIISVRKIIKNKLRNYILLFIIVIALFYVIQSFGSEIRLIETLFKLFENPENYIENGGAGSIGSRLYFITLSLDLFVENIFIGIGFGEWTVYGPEDSKYPHNIVLEILSETGIFGLGFLLIYVYFLSNKSIFAYVGYFALFSMFFSGDFSYFRYALFPLLMSYSLTKNKLNGYNL